MHLQYLKSICEIMRLAAVYVSKPVELRINEKFPVKVRIIKSNLILIKPDSNCLYKSCKPQICLQQLISIIQRDFPSQFIILSYLTTIIFLKREIQTAPDVSWSSANCTYCKYNALLATTLYCTCRRL